MKIEERIIEMIDDYEKWCELGENVNLKALLKEIKKLCKQKNK